MRAGDAASRSVKRSRHGARSSPCSFVVMLQAFLALLCCSFLFQWYHWRASPLVSRNALLVTEDLSDKRARLRGNVEGAQAPADAETATPFATFPRQAATAFAERNEKEYTQNIETFAPFMDPATARFVPPSRGASPEEITTWRQRFDPSRHTADQRQVADMAAWAWKAYETYAFGQDYLDVRKMKGAGLPGHDMAITLVDSLDTLFLLGMFEEFDRASEWVGENMKTRIYLGNYLSVFETTIRNLGGLLSAYYLSGQELLLTAAQELGDALSPAFHKHPHGIPDKDFDIMAKTSRWQSSVAEAGSVQLEYKYLARLTGNQQYHDQVERIMDRIFANADEHYPSGLLPCMINAHSGDIDAGSKITLGAYGDSYYEYLLKQWLLSGKKDDKYRTRYMTAVQGIMDNLIAKSKPNGLVFIGELVHNKLSPKMDHLVCFVPGMLALGYMHGMPEEHLTLAKQLIETCNQMYVQMDAKLAPEIAYFHMEDDAQEDLDIHRQDAFNLQRPETVESLMVLYRVTKDEKYRDYGRGIMNAFETHARLPEGGYTTLGNVARGPVQKKYREGMESFFLAETLKYLFLLFSDDDSLLPLDEIVFNTEAHPFPVAPAVSNRMFANE